MVAKKRERKPAIRLVRDSSSDEGGARSVVTFLFWNGAQWRRRWFISWVSASISEQSALSFPNRRKASKLKRNLKFSSFLSRFILFAFRLWIFLLDTVYIAPIDRPCLAISLLRFPFCGFLLNLPLHSSFHYCFLSFFFFLDLRSNPFFVVSWFFFPFDPRFHFRSREKRKTRWNVILFADIWRRQFFGRRGQTGYELQSRTSTRPTFHV